MYVLYIFQSTSKVLTVNGLTWFMGPCPGFGRGFSFVQTPYSQLGEAAEAQYWQNPAMKTLLTAGIVFLAGVALLWVIPDADIVPTGVRAVLDDVNSIW